MAPMTPVDVLEPRIGSLFSGYGGLDRGVQSVIGGAVSWHCDIDPGASKLLAHHWPETPNLGDVTAVDWAAVERIDVLTGGFPCQDVSSAGRRAGMTPDSRSGLWTHMARAINVLRPRLVVIENVRGLLSADAHCDVEPCPWCLGDHEGRPLRALGAVLGDLAVLGYDARWHGLRAADGGAPHGRFRIFIVATPGHADAGDPHGWSAAKFTRKAGPTTGSATDAGRGGPDAAVGGAHAVADPYRCGDTQEPASPVPLDGERPPRGRGAVQLDGTGRGHVSAGGGAAGEPTERRRSPGYDAPDGSSTAADADGGELQRRRIGGVVDGSPGSGAGEGSERERDRYAAEHGAEAARWGDYEPAIRRWELTLGRAAPAPTMTGKRGGQQLSPHFVEWLMGLPLGHVTDVPGLSRNDQLKLLGNGVVPQQAELALRHLLDAPVVDDRAGFEVAS